jgi:hypothetical protein
MTGFRLLGLVLILLAATPGFGADPPAAEEGTFLGVLFSPVPGGLGVRITHVLPGSPGANADLRRNDLLLRYDGTPIRDCEHLALLIQKDEPGRKVPLLVCRDSHEQSVVVTLGRGPAIRLAAPETEPPRGVAKPNGPPLVSVRATPLCPGQVRLVIEYYPEGARQPKTVTCEGELKQIEAEVQKLPERERACVQTVLKRLRALTVEPIPDRRAPMR